MTNYRETILACKGKIEKTFARDDLMTVTKKEMAQLILEVYDLLTEAVERPDWWERDEQGEQEQRERLLETLGK